MNPQPSGDPQEASIGKTHSSQDLDNFPCFCFRAPFIELGGSSSKHTSGCSCIINLQGSFLFYFIIIYFYMYWGIAIEIWLGGVVLFSRLTTKGFKRYCFSNLYWKWSLFHLEYDALHVMSPHWHITCCHVDLGLLIIFFANISSFCETLVLCWSSYNDLC